MYSTFLTNGQAVKAKPFNSQYAFTLRRLTVTCQYNNSSKMSSEEDKQSIKREVNWLCVIFNLQILISCICGIHFIIYEAYFLTTIFSFVLILLSMLGVTAGSHRLWAHHSYQATTGLRIFLMLCQTLVGHTSIYNWVRLHRVHHKYFKTELDPFNSERGLLFSHVISNNFHLSPAQEKALEEIDMSDIENDKIVMFQKKFYWFLFVILTLLLPINAPVEYWDETILNSVFVVGWLRFGITYHLSLLIHSASNIFDYDTTEKNSYDSNLVFFISKSYWLSYHYLLPWDYQTSEYGKYGTDCTSKFIRVCAALDLATDLKTVDSAMVQEALSVSVIEKKPIEECIKNLATKLPKQHYLTPSKFN